MAKAKRDIKRKLTVLNHYQKTQNVAKTCRHFGISRASYYVWKARYEQYGEEGLINKKPCPINIRSRVAADIEEKIIYLRKKYHLGPERIYMFIQRYHSETKVSASGIDWVLK